MYVTQIIALSLQNSPLQRTAVIQRRRLQGSKLLEARHRPLYHQQVSPPMAGAHDQVLR